MQVDNRAALHARKAIEVAAPVEIVRALLTGIDAWPAWQPDVTQAELEGELAVGTVFRWKARGMAIVSTLAEVDPIRRVGWTGRSPGLRADHRWELEPDGARTRVITEESLGGWLAALLKAFDPSYLEKSLAASLGTLKLAAERRAAEEERSNA